MLLVEYKQLSIIKYIIRFILFSNQIIQPTLKARATSVA